MDDGSEFTCRPGDVTLLPSGHDAWVEGDEPAVVDFLLVNEGTSMRGQVCVHAFLRSWSRSQRFLSHPPQRVESLASLSTPHQNQQGRRIYPPPLLLLNTWLQYTRNSVIVLSP
jgi:hypothetical protein